MTEDPRNVERPSRAELLSALRENRRTLSHEINDLGHAVNVKEKFETAFKRNAPWFIGGGFALGLVVSMVATPRVRVDKAGKKRTRSPLLGLVTAAGIQGLRLARPAISAFALREVRKYIGPKLPGASVEDQLIEEVAAQDEL